MDIKMTDEIAKYNADIIAADDMVVEKVKQKITLIKQAQKDSSVIKALQTELEAVRAKDLDALILDKSKLNVAAAWLAMDIERKQLEIIEAEIEVSTLKGDIEGVEK